MKEQISMLQIWAFIGKNEANKESSDLKIYDNENIDFVPNVFLRKLRKSPNIENMDFPSYQILMDQ